MEIFFDYINNIGNQFIDPKKRVFLAYIFLSFLIALFWFIYIKKINLKKALKKIFDKKIFFSKSAKSDYKVFFINQLIMMTVSPFLITQLTIATALYYYFHTIDWISVGMYKNTLPIIVIISFTTFQFIIDDFSKYIIHSLFIAMKANMYYFHIKGNVRLICRVSAVLSILLKEAQSYRHMVFV